MIFDFGTAYPVAVDVFNAAGVLQDPATAVCTITLPDGTTASVTIPLPSTVPGQLRATYQPLQPGRFQVDVITTAPNLGFSDAFDVAEQPPPTIISLAAAKAQLQIDPANTDDDAELREMLMGMTAALEEYKHEVIARRVITGEQHQYDLWSWSWQTPRPVLKWTPVISLDSLVSEDGVVNWLPGGSIKADTVGQNLYVESTTGIITVVRGTPITGWVIAGYTAGKQIIPYNYLQGAKVFLQWLWEERRGPGGVGGVVGPEELHSAIAHPYAIPRKVERWLGAQYPVVA